MNRDKNGDSQSTLRHWLRKIPGLLGMPGQKLVNMHFGHFVASESEDHWYRYIVSVIRHDLFLEFFPSRINRSVNLITGFLHGFPIYFPLRFDGCGHVSNLLLSIFCLV